ncbi:hypothetical protein Gotur_030520 [Gossypium turneri]
MFIFYIVCSVSSLHDVDGTGRSKQSRSEKKSQKVMLKLGMKPIPGVSRVTIKKNLIRHLKSKCLQEPCIEYIYSVWRG